MQLMPSSTKCPSHVRFGEAVSASLSLLLASTVVLAACGTTSPSANRVSTTGITEVDISSGQAVVNGGSQVTLTSHHARLAAAAELVGLAAADATLYRGPARQDAALWW